MSVRLILLALALGALLVGCVSTGNSDSLEQIERNHRQSLETAG